MTVLSQFSTTQVEIVDDHPVDPKLKVEDPQVNPKTPSTGIHNLHNSFLYLGFIGIGLLSFSLLMKKETRDK